jgi:hypothetical protein
MHKNLAIRFTSHAGIALLVLLASSPFAANSQAQSHEAATSRTQATTTTPPPSAQPTNSLHDAQPVPTKPRNVPAQTQSEPQHHTRRTWIVIAAATAGAVIAAVLIHHFTAKKKCDFCLCNPQTGVCD